MSEVNIPKGFDLNSPPQSQPEKSKEEQNKDKIRKIIESIRIDRTQPIEAPETCLSVVKNGKEAIIGTLGNISLIIGKAKSKKTFSLIMFFHAIVANRSTANNFTGHLPEGKTRAVFFDTEQSRYHVQRFDKRVCRLLKIDNPANFESFSLRKFAPKERLAIINQFIEDNPDVGFLAIDGIRDLVTSINDEEQATDIATHLLRWTEENNIHIVTVLHQNKGDSNARGHIGTELVNKAETVLSVTRDDQDRELSIVNAEFCRDREPEPFAFRINENGLPEVVEDWTPAAGKNNKVTAPDEVDEFIHKLNLCKIFEAEKEQTGSDLLDRIKIAYDFGDSKAKTFRTYFLDQGWIIHNTKNGKPNDPKGFYTLSEKLQSNDNEDGQIEF